MADTGTVFAFGPFELDAAAFVLRRGDEVVKLAPKAFDLLRYLVENRTRVVEKAELLDRLWAGEHVTEGVLPTHVRQLRRALGESRSQPTLIETVHGRGYRFIADVLERSGPRPLRSTPGNAGAAVPQEVRADLVGRRDVLRDLEEQLGVVESGRSALALLAGEPGIGKTRTAEELCRVAETREFRVLRGRCYEGEGAPAFWPWIQVLRAAFMEERDDAAVLAHLGAGASDVAHLVPELRVRFPDLPPAPALESDAARFRVFESVGSFLSSLSRERPLLLFLDDLHWADEATLLLLGYLARYGEAAVLILGAYRDVELRRDHALARLLGEMAREDRYLRITLRGLSREEVGEYVESALEGSERLLDRVFEMTQGNPFFLRETVHLLASEGGRVGKEGELHIALPQGVREAVGRRLSGLSSECNRLLGLAAAIGTEFDLNVLEAVSGLPRAELLELLEEAVAAGVLRDASGGAGAPRALRFGRFGFFHMLIRETLYDELTPIQRIGIHRRIADAIEQLDAGRGQRLSELAHHALQAAPGGDCQRAIEAGTRAAEQALELLAFEEAARHYRRCLEALELEPPVDDERRHALLLGLGWSLNRADDRSVSRGVFREVAALARRCERWEWLADAAMGIGGWPPAAGTEATIVNPEFRALVEEAVDRLGDAPTALRARLLSALALTPPDQDSMERRHELSEASLVMARDSADPAALFDALIARMWALLQPGEEQARLETADEMLALARRVGARDREFVAQEDRVRSLMALGDIAAVDRSIETMHELAGELRVPDFYRSVRRMRIMRAIGDGRFEEASALVDAMEAHEPQPLDVSSQVGIAVFRGIILHEQGRFADVFPMLDEFLEVAEWAGPGRLAAVAWFCADLGEADRASRYFETLAPSLPTIPQDEGWLMGIFYASLAAAELGSDAVAELYTLFHPFARMPVVHQRGRIFVGSSSLALARLAEAMGESAVAVAHYEEALAHNEALGAAPSLARTKLHYGRFLETRAAVGSTRSASQELKQAETLAADLGMQVVHAKARAKRAGSR